MSVKSQRIKLSRSCKDLQNIVRLISKNQVVKIITKMSQTRFVCKSDGGWQRVGLILAILVLFWVCQHNVLIGI